MSAYAMPGCLFLSKTSCVLTPETKSMDQLPLPIGKDKLKASRTKEDTKLDSNLGCCAGGELGII
eukprot:3131866-Ditylum_brightwellii.AAC.1